MLLLTAPWHPREAERLEALRLYRAHAILERDVMIVPDAMADERFADNPLVLAEPHIRFYAGAPLITPDGLPVGTLCVFDRVPRRLAPEQVQALGVLRDAVVAQLELRRKLLEASDLAAERDSRFRGSAPAGSCPSCGRPGGARPVASNP